MSTHRNTDLLKAVGSGFAKRAIKGLAALSAEMCYRSDFRMRFCEFNVAEGDSAAAWQDA